MLFWTLLPNPKNAECGSCGIVLPKALAIEHEGSCSGRFCTCCPCCGFIHDNDYCPKCRSPYPWQN